MLCVSFTRSGSSHGLTYKSSEEHLLIELDVRKALVVSISQRSEELRLYKLV
jgi:hypothetical protein